MQGLYLLFLNCYVSIKWKTITDSKVFIKVIVWVVEGNGFRRPITRDNISLAFNCVAIESLKKEKACQNQIKLPCLTFLFSYLSSILSDPS